MVKVLVEVRVPRAMPRSAQLQVASRPEWSGFVPDPDFTPVPVSPPDSFARDVEEQAEQVILLRGTCPEDMLPLLETRPEVIRVWRDTPIAPFHRSNPALKLVGEEAFGECPIPPCDCDPGTARGTIGDVAAFLGADQVWELGWQGQGVAIGIVDGGIAAAGRTPGGMIPNVVDGFPDDWGTRADWSQHGNMTATDAIGMAPKANLHDIRISDADTISAALAGFQWAIDRYHRSGSPQILSNSWGIYQRDWDPVYADDPDHPFTRKVVEAVGAGILVLFAAGNCGAACASDRCGSDVGPGRSIWGANGHPLVMTVGAANIDAELVGYSSTGPASLDPRKPDFCSITHFQGFFPVDTGTSAACPICAGIVALMKSAFPLLSQEGAKQALALTARDVGNQGWDQFSGWGIVNARAAFEEVAVNVVTEMGAAQG